MNLRSKIAITSLENGQQIKPFFPLTPRLINGNLNVNKNTEMGARHILGNR